MIVGVWLHYIPEEKENIEKYDKTTSRYLKFRDKLQRQLGVWKPKNTWCRQEWYIQMVYQMEEKIIFVKKVEYSMKNFFICNLAAPGKLWVTVEGTTWPNGNQFIFVFHPNVTGGLITRLHHEAGPSAQWGLNRQPSDSNIAH